MIQYLRPSRFQTLLAAALFVSLVQVAISCKDKAQPAPRNPEYVPLVIKFQIVSNWANLLIETTKNRLTYGNGSWFRSNPDVYFLLRIDGIQDPLVIPVVHKDCKDRPVNQTILFDNSLKGRRVIVEIWDSKNSVLMNNIRALVSGTRINVAVQDAVSASVSIDGKEIGPLLINSDKYICQAEMTLGQTAGSVKLNSMGGDTVSDLYFEILPSP